jgi:serine/threonine protein kinase HipA of HipAB toxin-antitoxin module
MEGQEPASAEETISLFRKIKTLYATVHKVEEAMTQQLLPATPTSASPATEAEEGDVLPPEAEPSQTESTLEPPVDSSPTDF